jgi:LPS export ABC transporter protein LptC
VELKNKAWIYWVIVAAFLAGVLYYYLREEPVKESTSQSSVLTRMTFSGSQLREEQDGKPLWELTAPVIEVDSTTTWIYMTDLKGKLYRPDGTKIDVTAKNAVINPRARDIELSGGLRMVAEDGTSLTADKGRYDGKEHKIYASGSIRATQADIVMTADELETDDKFDTLVVRKNARIVKGGPMQ